MSLFVCMHSLCSLQSQMMDWCVKFCLVVLCSEERNAIHEAYTMDVVYMPHLKKDLRYLPSIKIQEQRDYSGPPSRVRGISVTPLTLDDLLKARIRALQV